MQFRRITQISVSSAIMAAILGFSASPALAATMACVSNDLVEVCLEWSQGQAPLEGTDFAVTYHGLAGADVELRTADLEWRLFTLFKTGGAVADLGDITINDEGADDYEVAINYNGGPGAVNVGNITLDDVGFSGFSSIENFEISGDLGGLTVVQDSGGNGGKVAMTVDGDVTGAMTFPVS